MIDLDDLPLDLLIALQGLMTDTSEEGLELAKMRAAEAGFSLVRGERIAVERAENQRPIQAEEAPEGVEAKHLYFDSSIAPRVLIQPAVTDEEPASDSDTA